jgi:hypothetical protein
MRSPCCMYMYAPSPKFFVFYAVRVLSKESRRLVILRTSLFKIYNFVHEEGSVWDTFIENRHSGLIFNTTRCWSVQLKY